MKKVSKKRVWLNSVNSHHNGWIKYGVSSGDYLPEYDVEFRLADCSRYVALTLDTYTKSDRIKSIKKLQIIADAALETIQQIKDIANETRVFQE